MTKLTTLGLYILTDTLLHSLQSGNTWSGCPTQEARVNLLNKLQKIMSEIEVEILPGDGTIDELEQGITQHPRDGL